jgi:hypothetical protein
MQKEDAMPLLQVRGCPEDIYAQIAQIAKKERRTIAQQTIVLLLRGLGQEQSNKERRRMVLERIAAYKIPEAKRKAIDKMDFTKLIREDRNR